MRRLQARQGYRIKTEKGKWQNKEFVRRDQLSIRVEFTVSTFILLAMAAWTLLVSSCEVISILDWR